MAIETDLHEAASHFEDGHVEGAAAQIEDQHQLGLLLQQSVCEGGGLWLLEQLNLLQSCQFSGSAEHLASVFKRFLGNNSPYCGVSLRIREVGRYSNHGILYCYG